MYRLGNHSLTVSRYLDEILGPVSPCAGAEGHGFLLVSFPGRSWRVKELIPSSVLNPVDHLRDFMERPHIILTRTSEMIPS